MNHIRNIWAGSLVAAASVTLLHAPAAQAGTEVVVHSFQTNGTDGYEPEAGLTNVNGILFGVTNRGGTASVGTVFSIDPAGNTEKIVYSFQNNGADGVNPVGGLLNIKGALYGTTYYGGSKSVGAVFKVNSSTGKENVVYSFCSAGGVCADGYYPLAGLITVNGTLYGTTTAGGSANGGTVFAVNKKTGHEALLYSFQRDGADGNTPDGGVINASGTLYGTTAGGGSNGEGTVFSVTASTGKEKVLHSFDGTDGDQPGAGLTNVKGTLYGTAANGGSDDYGTVFKIDPSTGTQTVLHSFTGGSDGYNPEAGLINVKGTLYGTTYRGGINGGGTVFKINPSTGAEKVLYSFCSQASCADGNGPLGDLINVNGTLYGTTISGGAYGQGTVYKIKL